MKKIILIRFGVFFKILIEESFSFWNDFFEYCATDNFFKFVLYDLNVKRKNTSKVNLEKFSARNGI